MFIKIDMTKSQLSDIQLRVGQPPPYALPVDTKGLYSGIFKIAGVNHVGDTRGNDWYSKILGVSNTWIPPGGDFNRYGQ